eukprot:g2368.t1
MNKNSGRKVRALPVKGRKFDKPSHSGSGTIEKTKKGGKGGKANWGDKCADYSDAPAVLDKGDPMYPDEN